jgi:hypothetical protein
MTKKDFEAIAQAVVDARYALAPMGVATPILRQHQQVFDSLSRTLADVCATTNPRFQRMRFLSACGVDTANQPLQRNK